MEISRTCFEAGINVMLYKVPEKDIVWIVVDDGKFSYR
jgi:hypothetical protein